MSRMKIRLPLYRFLERSVTVYAKIAIFMALFFLVGEERVSACSCAPEELDKAVLRADYILVGTIRSRQDTPPDSHGISSDADPVYFEVAVERMLKGEPHALVTVVTPGMSASCGYPFEQGTRYLIFGYHADGTPPEHIQKENVIRTNLCTLTTAENVDVLATQIEKLLTERSGPASGDLGPVIPLLSPTPAHADIFPETSVCGGIAGIPCPEGYRCEYPEPSYPDAQGVCKKIAAPPPPPPTEVPPPAPPLDPAGGRPRMPFSAPQGMQFSPELRDLLRAEMRELAGAVQAVALALSTADWETLVSTSAKMRASYLLETKLSASQRQEFERLPEQFKKLDEEFHLRAEKLGYAALAHDAELVAFQFSRLLESCTVCHAAYAKPRFPGFLPSKPGAHHH